MINYNDRRTMLRGALLDCAIWFSGPGVFLYVYVSRFGVPAGAIRPHLRYVGAVLIALWCVRVFLEWTTPGIKLRRAITTLLTSAAIALLLLYYSMVIIGLNSWNRVVSWDLVSGYLPHLRELAATLEIAPFKAGLIAGVAVLTLLACVWYYLKKFDWVVLGVRATRPRMRAIYLASGCLLTAVQVFTFANFPATEHFEPFALTVFPDLNSSILAYNKVDQLHASRLDEREDRERTAYKPNLDAKKRNVVMIVVDALRKDHMGVYGYERDTTPFLSKLSEGDNFQKVLDLRGSCSETVCGLLSLHTSKFVSQFSSRPITMQEVLRRHGYTIRIVLGGDHTNFYGMTKIYRDVDSFFDGSMAKGMYPNDDRFVTGKAEALPVWDGRPTLLQFHLMSAHILGKRNAGTGHFTPAKTYARTPNVYSAGAGTVLESTRNYYDNGVVQADNSIREILNSAERKGYLSNTIVIVTADHGEAIGEHGLYTHANGVHEPLLRIPFIVISYGEKATALPKGLSNASQVDIAPTVLAQLNIPAPATWTGVALQNDTVNAYSLFDQANWHGLVDQSDPTRVWKYWIDARTHTEYAFDIKADPNELRNLIDEVDPGLKKTWRRKLLSLSR